MAKGRNLGYAPAGRRCSRGMKTIKVRIGGRIRRKCALRSFKG